MDDLCRLPTEAEWEYACRAGTTTPINTGNSLTTYKDSYSIQMVFTSAWGGEYKGNTLQVGSLTPDKWGVYDMHSNVSEWCSDVILHDTCSFLLPIQEQIQSPSSH